MRNFSLVIPSRNRDNLSRCVAAIRTAGENCPIIVVDDGVEWHQDDLGKMIAVNQIIPGAKPFCFARNCNLGIVAAGADGADGADGASDVFLWNDDALLIAEPGSHPLTDMVHAIGYSRFETQRPWGVVSCAVKGHPGPAFPNARYRHDAIQTGVARSLWPVREVKGRMVPFTAVYIPDAVLYVVGPLDERFCGVREGHEVYGGEDDDYCYRARRSGYALGVFDGALVDHATLPSTFRPDGKGRSIEGARARFQEIHGFQMGTR